MPHPITLTISTGRCGTTWLHDLLRSNYAAHPAAIFHESLRATEAGARRLHRAYDAVSPQALGSAPWALLQRWRELAERGPVIDLGWSLRSLVPGFHAHLGEQLRVLVLHRHPVEVAASKTVAGVYRPGSFEVLAPSDPGSLLRAASPEWAAMNAFEKNLWNWAEVHAYALEVGARLPREQVLVVSTRQLSGDGDWPERIAAFAGLPGLAGGLRRLRPSNRRLDANLEQRPLGEQWRSWRRRREVGPIAEQLGYLLDEDSVAAIAARYQRPPGLAPWLRAITGYWPIRARLARVKARLRG